MGVQNEAQKRCTRATATSNEKAGSLRSKCVVMLLPSTHCHAFFTFNSYGALKPCPAQSRLTVLRKLSQPSKRTYPKQSMVKIIGVGLSRTGTSSLAAALQLLGISCIHAPDPAMLEYASAMVDGPAAARYQELDVLYPRSKFILTLRETEDWLRSCQEHWNRTPLGDMHPRARFEYGWCRVKLFGQTGFDRDNHRKRYELHVKNVRDYFQDRSPDLLELNIAAGEGWDKLCPFLGVATPAGPFPWENRENSRFST